MINIVYQVIQSAIHKLYKTYRSLHYSGVGIELFFHSAGYIQGDEKGSFKPTAHMTREQAVVTLVKLLRLHQDRALSVSLKDDTSISSWSKSSVYSAVNHGLIRGYVDQTFRPQGELTRAETVQQMRSF
ncbi:Cellulosome-anchoring protein precursor [compost metagenome]